MSEVKEMYRLLAVKIWQQAIHDYAILALPSQQRTKEQRVGFHTAAIFIWIDDFYLENFFDYNHDEIHIEDFLKLVADRERVSSIKMRKYAKQQLYDQWKDIRMLKNKIPNIVVIDAEPYWIYTKDTVAITEPRHIILSSKENTDIVWEELFNQILTIYIKRQKIVLSVQDTKKISSMFYNFIKINELKPKQKTIENALQGESSSESPTPQ